MGELPKKVLIHVLASGEWNGPERYAFDICRYFSREGWEVSVLTRDAKAIDRNFGRFAIPVRHAPLRDYPDYYSAKVLASLFKDIPRGEGIVHVHRYNDALTCIIARKIAKRPDIRLVATRHKADKGRDSYLRRIIYRGLDFHLFVSDYSRGRFYEGWKNDNSPLSKEKTAVTYNSLYPLEASGSQEPRKVPRSIAYRGGLKPGKGLETLIEALGMVKDLRLRVKMVGRGAPDYVDKLRRLAHKAAVSDQIDWIRESDFPDRILREALFGVFPSAVPEAFGMANLEVMAQGRPQITTFEGAQSEFIIPERHALKIAPDDPEGLAQAIRRLAADEGLRDKMGADALQYFNDNFSWQKFLERLLPAYLP